MPVVVRVAVENRYTRSTPSRNQASPTIWINDGLADEALWICARQEIEVLRGWWLLLIRGLDIAEPPRGPDSLVLTHGQKSPMYY